MNDTEGRVVLDTSAVLALIYREAGADTVAAIADRAALSAVNLAEVLTKMAERGVSPVTAFGSLMELGLTVIPLSPDHAMGAAELRDQTRHAGLSVGDRCCLALARSLGLPALTADRPWARIEVGVEVRLIR